MIVSPTMPVVQSTASQATAFFGVRRAAISPTPTPVPTQFVTFADFFTSISNYIQSTGIVGPKSSFWAIEPDLSIKWPSSAPPFMLIHPKRMTISGDDVGGGRFAKLWDVTIDIHVVVLNVYDPAYSDTTVVTSGSSQTGPYELVQLLIDKLEAAYITTPDGDYSTVEFPRATQIGELNRFKTTNMYVSIPVSFTMAVAQNLPSTIFVSATPN